MIRWSARTASSGELAAAELCSGGLRRRRRPRSSPAARSEVYDRD